MIKLICALLAALTLASPALAAADPASAEADDSLAARFEAFREEYGLDETNFAVSYYDTVTG